ncbi:hypothetical protein G8A07_13515 [Roseateles sp. DAIF2]|uniref:HvfC/BufC N-terminal domain-containing protein n=1 Tax=Roseateles sp. DAIF2 TaxID=2714952 RepID=UPI0018A27420|nr:DNA-binding domain-containing protein [Roseateles sp. DAIF2]QPF73835.1 hypothetical protein G8A07_13515 [Roseateles sp. DAIF2]
MMSGYEIEARRQRALLAALDLGQPPMGALGLSGGAEAGLLAYRRNAQGLAERALAAVFPRLQALLGEAQFAAMAWAFWRRHPPRGGDLGDWGQDLPGFLAAQTQMEVEPPALARLEWALHQAERAADIEPDPASLALLASHPPQRLRPRLAPGLQLLSEDGILVWRRGWLGESCAVDAGTAGFSAQLLAGARLGPALEASLAAHPDFDFSAWLQAALREGWLLGIDEDPEDPR